MLTNSVPCDYVLYFYLLFFFHSDVAFLFSDTYFQNAYSFALLYVAKINTIFFHF